IDPVWSWPAAPTVEVTTSCLHGEAGLPMFNLIAPSMGDRVAIEVWIEKSGANDILLPIAESRRVTFVAGSGAPGVAHRHAVVSRVLRHRRPTRILYIADFDPAGHGMPVSVSRKIEFFIRQGGEDLDVQVIPLVLTAQQVRRYRLPRKPIKDTDKRKA